MGNINPQNEISLDTILDFYYTSPVLNNDSIEVTFGTPSGLPSVINVILEQKDEFGEKVLCNKTITSSSGSISCDYSESLGKSYIDYYIYKDGVPIVRKSYIIPGENQLDWLGNNYICIFILLLSLVSMTLTSPEWMVIISIVTFVLAGALFLAGGLSFVVGLGSIAWLLFAGIIIISKMSKQEDR